MAKTSRFKIVNLTEEDIEAIASKIEARVTAGVEKNILSKITKWAATIFISVITCSFGLGVYVNRLSNDIQDAKSKADSTTARLAVMEEDRKTALTEWRAWRDLVNDRQSATKYALDQNTKTIDRTNEILLSMIKDTTGGIKSK